MSLLADLGGPRGQAPLALLKLVKKRWPPCAAASFASHVAPPPLDKFLDPLLVPVFD